MELISPWWAVLSATVASWLSYRIGYKQAKIAARTLDLSVARASPKIRVEIEIDQSQEHSAGIAPCYYLVSRICNEGELPVKQLKGKCKLFSPVNKSQEHVIPISLKLLGTTPLELDAVRLDGLFIDTNRPSDALFHVDIDFEYFGIPDDKPQRYSAQYVYDQKSLKMVKVR